MSPPVDEDLVKVQLLFVQLQLGAEAITADLEDHRLRVLADAAHHRILIAPRALKTLHFDVNISCHDHSKQVLNCTLCLKFSSMN